MDHKLVSITPSSFYDARSHPIRAVVDFETHNHFDTKNEANSWIQYEFNVMKVKLTHYSIQARHNYNGYHLRSWTLEGSNDGLSWVKLDHRENDTTLNSQGAIATFSISEGHEEAFCQIRLRQTGKESGGYDHLTLSAMEFFGVLNPQT
jgi:hypothetical protein